MPRFNDIEQAVCQVKFAEDGCWVWGGNYSDNGYGKLTVNYKTVSAHRFFYAEVVGPIPEGMHLDHVCDHKYCVNPDHLEPVTHAENMRRRYAKMTHCINGHPFSGDNLHIRIDGRRVCKECNRQRGRKYLEKTAVPLARVLRR